MGMPFSISSDVGRDDPRSLHFNKGAFDSFEHEHLPRTKYDQIIDEKSNKPGEQAFEVRPRHITACVRSFAIHLTHRICACVARTKNK